MSSGGPHGEERELRPAVVARTLDLGVGEVRCRLDVNGFDDPVARPQQQHRRLGHRRGGRDGQSNARGPDHVRKACRPAPPGAPRPDMQVAIVSDIHGNRHALEAVLDDVEASTDATEMWCLGDLVGYGADPNDCVALVREHARVCLAGNHDLAVTGDAAARRVLAPARRSPPAGPRRSSPTSTSSGCEPRAPRRLDGERRALPRQPPRPDLGVRPLGAAGRAVPRRRARARSPSSATPTSRWRSTARRASRAQGAACRGGDSADLTTGEWLLNPGSVGQPRDGDARAAWLLLDTTARSAQWRRTEYDIAGAAVAIRAARLPDSLAERLGVRSMRMRAFRSWWLLLLGGASALLVACGGDRSKLIPARDASDLTSAARQGRLGDAGRRLRRGRAGPDPRAGRLRQAALVGGHAPAHAPRHRPEEPEQARADRLQEDDLHPADARPTPRRRRRPDDRRRRRPRRRPRRPRPRRPRRRRPRTTTPTTTTTDTRTVPGNTSGGVTAP